MRRLGFWLVLFLIGSCCSFAQDEKRWAETLLDDTKKLEEQEESLLPEKRNYQKIIDEYDFVITKAKEQSKPSTICEALFRKARCLEKKEPQDVPQAQELYNKIISDYPSETMWVKKAKEKIKLKGIDVYLTKLKAEFEKLDKSHTSNPQAFIEKENEIWSKISQMGKGAMAGLISGLASEDIRIRTFAANKLPEVADENCIKEINSCLDPSKPVMLAGVFQALRSILNVYIKIDELEKKAEKIESSLLGINPENSNSQKIRDDILLQAKHIREEAESIRHNLPTKEKISAVFALELETIVNHPALPKEAKIEVINLVTTLSKISKIKAQLEDAIFNCISQKDVDIKKSAILCLGEIDSARAVNILSEIVQYEPEKDTKPSEERDWSNTSEVRVAAAELLGKIGKISAIPPLIKALDDNDVKVRAYAKEALFAITKKDFSYEADAPLEERNAAIEKYKASWDTAQGIDILLSRFITFLQEPRDNPLLTFFDKDYFDLEIEGRIFNVNEEMSAQIHKVADDVYQKFQEQKKKFQDKFLELEDKEKLFTNLLKYLGGEGPNVEIVTSDVGKKAEIKSAVRFFVTQILAEILTKLGGEQRENYQKQIIDIATAEERDKKLGAILTFGTLATLSPDMITDKEVDTVANGISDSTPELRAGAAYSLGLLGEKAKSKIENLSSCLLDPDANVKVSAIIAINKIRGKSDNAINNLAEIMKNENEKCFTKRCAIRCLGCLNEASPAGIRALAYIRTDSLKILQNETTKAIRNIAKASPKTMELIIELLKDNDPRIKKGAICLAGDIGGNSSSAKVILYHLVDKKFPREVKDTNPEVREISAWFFGKTKLKTQKITIGLIEAMEKDVERVRLSAYTSLKTIFSDVPEFKPDDTESKRDKAIREIKKWFKNIKSQLPEE